MWTDLKALCLERSALKYFKPLLMHFRIAFDDDFLAGRGLDLSNQNSVPRLQRGCYAWMNAQVEDFAVDLRRHLARFRDDVITHGGDRLDPAGARAMRARLA